MDHQKMLAWANNHVERLQETLDNFLRREPYPLDLEYDAQTAKVVGRLRVQERFPENFVLVLGDALHNFRVALDYLAFAVVAKHTPTVYEGLPMFPIYTSITDYTKSGERRIKDAHPGAIKVFERLQPYNRPQPHSVATHPLALLNLFEAFHKHRKLLVCVMPLTSASIAFMNRVPTPAPVCHMVLGPLVDGAITAEWSNVSVEDRAGMNMKSYVVPSVHFALPSLDAGMDVFQTLAAIRSGVMYAFHELEPFLA